MLVTLIEYRQPVARARAVRCTARCGTGR
jgi:hypothetical protein